MVLVEHRHRCPRRSRFTGRRAGGRVSWKRRKARTQAFSSVVSGFRYYSPSIGRWLSRDPIEEMRPETTLGQSDGPNLYYLVRNNPLNYVDYLGLRSIPFGAGQLCVDKKCKAKDLDSLRYLSEDNNTSLQQLPTPGTCVDADALYVPGSAWKIPDNGKITVTCDKDGCLTNIKYFKWPWWLGSGPEWEAGKPKPPKWPGDIPPYENEPPK